MGKKGDQGDFECDMFAGARWSGLGSSETTALLGFSCPTIRSTENDPKNRKYPVKGQRRIQRLVPDNSEPKVTKITTGYNPGMQNHSSQHTSCGSLQMLGYRKVRLRLTLVHQNCTAEDWENIA